MKQPMAGQKTPKKKNQKLTMVFRSGVEEDVIAFSYTAYVEPGPSLHVTLVDKQGQKLGVFTNVQAIFKSSLLPRKAK